MCLTCGCGDEDNVRVLDLNDDPTIRVHAHLHDPPSATITSTTMITSHAP